jgi:hypothetical protein
MNGDQKKGDPLVPDSRKPPILGMHFVGIVFLLLGLFLLQPQTYLPPFFYTQGQCLITHKRLASHSRYSKQLQGPTSSYAPVFEFTVQTTDQHRYQTDGSESGYGYKTGSVFGSQTTAQTILDSYHLGQTYPCWYDPANPTHAVLVRDFGPPGGLIYFFLFLLGVGIEVCTLWLQVKQRRD